MVISSSRSVLLFLSLIAFKVSKASPYKPEFRFFIESDPLTLSGGGVGVVGGGVGVVVGGVGVVGGGVGVDGGGVGIAGGGGGDI